MKIEGTHQIQAPRERVFQCLTNPEGLQRCIPGCERLEKVAEDTYSATIRAGIGTIKGVFTGTVKLEYMRPPEHYRIVVEGKGGPGFVKGSGNLDLEAQDDSTIIKYTGELQVGGTIASVGQRMIQATAKMMSSQFFTALEAEARVTSGEPPPKHGFFRTALRWFSGWLKRLLNR
ncbi:MAG: SRPBCC family protein [Pyrinomonadaceae bacterium]